MAKAVQIKKLVRKALKEIVGSNFSDESLPISICFQAIFWQKILRINGSVPWPVHVSTQVKCYKNIRRGTRFPGLSPRCHLDARNGIELGQNVWIGPNVSIISMNHDVLDYNSYVRAEPIRIGNDCWVGAGAIILPEVELGDHTVVAAGAVVTKSFSDGDQIIGGCPARVLKKIGPYEAGFQ